MIKELFDAYLETRLYEWARYYIDIEKGRVGYPKKSLIAIVMDMGILTHTPGPKSPINNEKAEEVNYWVRKMGIIYPKYEEAIRDHCFYKHIPLKEIAKIRGVSIRTFKDRVQSAKIWLSGHVAANDYKFEPNN